MEGVRWCDIIHVLIILLQELRQAAQSLRLWSRRSVADEGSPPMSVYTAATVGSSIFSKIHAAGGRGDGGDSARDS